MKDGPARLAGLQIGDVITSIDRTPTAGATFERSVAAIMGAEGTTVRLVVLRGAKELRFDVVRARLSAPAVQSKLLAIDKLRIGYLRLSAFQIGTAPVVSAALDKLQARKRRGARARPARQSRRRVRTGDRGRLALPRPRSDRDADRCARSAAGLFGEREERHAAAARRARGSKQRQCGGDRRGRAARQPARAARRRAHVRQGRRPVAAAAPERRGVAPDDGDLPDAGGASTSTFAASIRTSSSATVPRHGPTRSSTPP